MSAIKDCCRAIADKYESLYPTGAKEFVALFCPTCSSRITFADGEWHAGTP